MYVVIYYIPYEGYSVEEFKTLEELKDYVKECNDHNVKYNDLKIYRVIDTLDAKELVK